MKYRSMAVAIAAALLAGTATARPAKGGATDLAATGRWENVPVGHAPTPQMGWNSWNSFGTDVDEAKVMGAAEALVRTGLADKGYRYVNIDDGWWLRRRQSDGQMVVRTAIFPSAAIAAAITASVSVGRSPRRE